MRTKGEEGTEALERNVIVVSSWGYNLIYALKISKNVGVDLNAGFTQGYASTTNQQGLL
jgi:hypothetical protein